MLTSLRSCPEKKFTGNPIKDIKRDENMNIGALTCLLMGCIFGFTAAVFAVLGEKGAMLISGFNTLPKEEREKYDKKKMSADQRNQCLVWTGVMAAGALGSWLVSQYAALAAGVIWLVFFFKNVHLYADKAFEKYKK